VAGERKWQNREKNGIKQKSRDIDDKQRDISASVV